MIYAILMINVRLVVLIGRYFYVILKIGRVKFILQFYCISVNEMFFIHLTYYYKYYEFIGVYIFIFFMIVVFK
ncbi:membrane protein of unknown function [Xenorhabdus bovienii]|uniref:Uncharacterized protein n=1 Tax=Xenorhabdus bovienii TaxID=40576 RepID=A0A0B6X2J2_XENBV|nr:membrane protein of unknown function [Xenorhabdus bovienii]